MEPIFTLPYSEFCVAQQLAELLPAKKGYSLYAPVSRHQPGVDLLIAKRSNQSIRVASIQVKSSRTYLNQTTTARTRKPFDYGTWFKNFECSSEANFFCLVFLYPAVNKAQRRELGTWWAPQIFLFSQKEMRQFLRSVGNVRGDRGSFFSFSFNKVGEAVLTVGDPKQRNRDFSKHLLSRRLDKLRRFLSA